MNDYDRIAAVIRYLDEHHREQPDLARLAAVVGISPYHFHRLFRAWAGITAKDFLQCLTLSHVRSLLRDGESVLNASLNAGLSGPGRLHDLCVSLEAVSPGELKAGGRDLSITYGYASSPFGECLVGETARGVCHLSFVEAGEWATALAALRLDWPEATFRRDDVAASTVAAQAFARPIDGRPSLRACVRGTAFQVRVWRALLDIRSGSLVTYGQLAAAVDRPSAARAVGTALAANPLAYLIPCHRVIRETGVVGGYRWGGLRKRAIIAWEAASCLPVESASPGSLAVAAGNRADRVD